jgi:hypothetical protein
LKKTFVLRSLATVATLALIPLTTWCTADLADGNPCRALVNASCKWLDKCHLLPLGVTASECLTDAENDNYGYKGPEYLDGVPIGTENILCGTPSSDDARSCASDLDALGCPAASTSTSNTTSTVDGGASSSVPLSCQAITFDPSHYIPPAPNSSGDGGSSGDGSEVQPGEEAATGYVASVTCTNLLVALSNSPYVSPKGSCSAGGSVPPGQSWIQSDPHYGSCYDSDDAIYTAESDCVAAGCAAVADPTMAATYDAMAVSEVDSACVDAPTNVTCSFTTLSLWTCAAATAGEPVDASTGGTQTSGSCLYPITCTGCCDINNTCQLGTSNIACGTKGAACAVCSTNSIGCYMGGCYP